MDFVRWLLDTEGFVPRWACGDWPVWFGVLWLVANGLIVIAYYGIPTQLWMLRGMKRAYKLLGELVLWFAAFILLCGTTHLCEMIVFWWPAYHLFSLVYLATALISLRTMFLLYRLWPRLKTFKTPEEYEKIIEENEKLKEIKRAKIRDLERLVAQLQNKVLIVADQVERRQWHEIKLADFRQLHEGLTKLEATHPTR